MIAIIVIVIMITITTITILMVTVTIFGTILKSIKYITVTWARSRWEKRESCHHPDIPSPPARKRIMSNSTVWSCENSSAVNFRKFTLVLRSSKRAVVFRLISPLVVFFGCLAAIHYKGASPKLTRRLRGMGFTATGAFALTAFFQKSLRISFARCFSRHYFCGCCWIL